MICPFCKQQEATLLCDGRFDDGRTCNASVCWKCAQCVASFHMRLARRVNRSRCQWETIDLCPACKAAERKTNWGGISIEEARRELNRATDRQLPLFGAP